MVLICFKWLDGYFRPGNTHMVSVADQDWPHLFTCGWLISWIMSKIEGLLPCRFSNGIYLTSRVFSSICVVLLT
jgi:hypothetical protein